MRKLFYVIMVIFLSFGCKITNKKDHLKNRIYAPELQKIIAGDGLWVIYFCSTADADFVDQIKDFLDLSKRYKDNGVSFITLIVPSAAKKIPKPLYTSFKPCKVYTIRRDIVFSQGIKAFPSLFILKNGKVNFVHTGKVYKKSLVKTLKKITSLRVALN